MTSDDRLRDATWLRHEYLTKMRSTIDIAEELGVSGGSVWYALKREGIERRPRTARSRYRAKACAVCSTSFTPTGPAARYCDQCGERILAESRDRARLRKYPHPCEVCGTEIVDFASVQRCDSEACQLATRNAKRCYACERDLPFENFGRDRSRADGLNARCRECATDTAKRHKAKNPDRARAYARNAARKHRHQKAGFAEGLYDELLESQRGMCAICGRTPEATGRHHLALDHNHATGETRGLLCNPCNVALGNFAEDPARLRSAIRYLKKHSTIVIS